MSITGEGPDHPPVKAGPPITDITAGILAAMGVLAAYVHRLKTGEGQRVDTSLLEAGVTTTYWQSAICLATGVSPGAIGSAHPLNAPYQALPTADGWINIGAANQANWLRLTKPSAGPSWRRRALPTNAARMHNISGSTAILSACLKRRTTGNGCGIWMPPGSRRTRQHRGDALTDPQVLARWWWAEASQSRRHPCAWLPIKFSHQASIRRPAAVRRAHVEILVEKPVTMTATSPP